METWTTTIVGGAIAALLAAGIGWLLKRPRLDVTVPHPPDPLFPETASQIEIDLRARNTDLSITSMVLQLVDVVRSKESGELDALVAWPNSSTSSSKERGDPSRLKTHVDRSPRSCWRRCIPRRQPEVSCAENGQDPDLKRSPASETTPPPRDRTGGSSACDP